MGVTGQSVNGSLWLSREHLFRLHELEMLEHSGPHVHVLVGAFNHGLVQKWDVSMPQISDKPDIEIHASVSSLFSTISGRHMLHPIFIVAAPHRSRAYDQIQVTFCLRLSGKISSARIW